MTKKLMAEGLAEAVVGASLKGCQSKTAETTEAAPEAEKAEQ